MENIKEAAVGNIDKLYNEMDKVVSTVNKAQNALLDVADELTDLILSANQIGGKIAQIVPSHLMPHISALTKMANTDLTNIIGTDPESGTPAPSGQASSLMGLKELIGNIPYKDMKPQNTNDVRQQISMMPNLEAGPQSAVMQEQTVEQFYKRALQEQAQNYQYNETILNFDKLKESDIFGMQYEADMMEALNMKIAKPIDTKVLREKIRTRVDQNEFEDTEPLQEGTPLSLDNLTKMGIGDAQGLNLNFSALREGFSTIH